MQAVPIILGCLLLAALLFAGGAALRAGNAGSRRREVVRLRAVLLDVENLAHEQLQIDPTDLTAHRVASTLRTARQKEIQ